MRSASSSTSPNARLAGEDLPRLIVPWSEFVALVADRTRTPSVMQQQYRDETTTSWGADAIDESTIVVADAVEPTLVTDSSREPRALLAPTERDPNIDLIQAHIEAGGEDLPKPLGISSADEIPRSYLEPLLRMYAVAD